MTAICALDILAIEGSILGGAPDLPGLVAVLADSRSGDCSPAEGGGDGGATGARGMVSTIYRYL